MLKNRLIYTITIVYTLAIIALSFMNLRELPELKTGFDDKIFHCIAYALFCLLWYLCFEALKIKSSLIFAIVFSIVFGGLIEILQSKLSSYKEVKPIAIATDFETRVSIVKNKLYKIVKP